MKRCSTALASIATGGTSSSRTATPECQHSIPAVRLTPLEKFWEVACSNQFGSDYMRAGIGNL